MMRTSPGVVEFEPLWWKVAHDRHQQCDDGLILRLEPNPAESTVKPAQEVLH
jgi:hypothetical protein